MRKARPYGCNADLTCHLIDTVVGSKSLAAICLLIQPDQIKFCSGLDWFVNDSVSGTNQLKFKGELFSGINF